MRRLRSISDQTLGIFLLAAAIGTLGGLLGAGFQHGVRWLQSVLIGPSVWDGGALADAVTMNLATWQRLLLPAAGGFLAGLVLFTIKNQRSPFGIADIVGLVALRKGTIKLRESLTQIVSSACSIGSGGSIGREGANSQIAATLAAAFSRLVHGNSRQRSVLLGCGVAAGMACSYNAPIAGAIFVMEAVLGNFAMDVFAPVVVASVLSTMIRRELIAVDPIYGSIDVFPFDSTLILSALVLGAVCGGGGVLFRGALRLGTRAFGAIPAPLAVRMALGGLAVGVIGIWLPQTWGNGYDAIQQITAFVDDPGFSFGAPAAGLVFSLVLFKVVATACTAGSGALGGIFTPNLVVGAALGAFFAYAVQWLWPDVAEAARHDQITFALVGMAGLCAATMHTPITAVVLVFELTQKYELILPVMLCSIVASIVARTIDKDSYYSANIRAKGDELPTGLEELAIKTNYVRDIMRHDLVTVRETASFEEVLEILSNTRRGTIYVVDERGGLIGHIQLHDVKTFINDPTLGTVVIAGDLTRPAHTVGVEQSLASVIDQFDDPDREELAVAGDGPTPILLGRLTRRDVIACFSDEVLGQKRLRAKFKVTDEERATHVEMPPGYDIGRAPVPDEWVGLAFDSIDVHGTTELTVFLIARFDESGYEHRFAPAPELVLEQGWDLIVMGKSDAIDAFRQRGVERE